MKNHTIANIMIGNFYRIHSSILKTYARIYPRFAMLVWNYEFFDVIQFLSTITVVVAKKTAQPRVKLKLTISNKLEEALPIFSQTHYRTNQWTSTTDPSI